MTLQQAITEYKQLKAQYEASLARAELVRLTLLPDAKQALMSAVNSKEVAERALRDAGTVQEAKAAREAATVAEQNFKDSAQLKDNLDEELKSWDIGRSQQQADLTLARGRMFELKRLEMLGAFSLSAQQLEQLENIIAAKSAATRSPRNGYADPIKEKYGEMDGNKKSQLEQALLDGMIALVP